MLKMKSACEKCGESLAPIDHACICSYECTFCPPCTEAMSHICPNCAGELVTRPKRARGPVAVAGGQLRDKLSGLFGK